MYWKACINFWSVLLSMCLTALGPNLDHNFHNFCATPAAQNNKQTKKKIWKGRRSRDALGNKYRGSCSMYLRQGVTFLLSNAKTLHKPIISQEKKIPPTHQNLTNSEKTKPLNSRYLWKLGCCFLSFWSYTTYKKTIATLLHPASHQIELTLA